MTDLTTTYLGLELRNPLVCSSSPLCQDLDALRRMEDAGAAAVVLHSLFEEQIRLEFDSKISTDSRYLPELGDYNFGPDGYLEHIREARALLGIPVIASLNGRTRGGWLRYARLMAQAGASAVELNVYEVPTDRNRGGRVIEQELVEMVLEVVRAVSIPVAVKIGPCYSAPAELAHRLEKVGARGLVLFNRFFQPDFDLENRLVVPTLQLSTPEELRLRLHWAAILFGQAQLDLAVTGGVHSGLDVLKVLLAGGRVAMMTSALLRHGVEHLRRVLGEVRTWLEEHECQSIRPLIGSMSFEAVPDRTAYERGNYLKVLQSQANSILNKDRTDDTDR